jgi:hypothetical protein
VVVVGAVALIAMLWVAASTRVVDETPRPAGARSISPR